MKYEFDTVVPRQGTHSSKWEKYKGADVLPLWVADMDFPVAPEIQQALQERLTHGIIGYTVVSDELKNAVVSHVDDLFGWKIEADWLSWLPGVVPGLSAAVRAFMKSGDEVMINPPVYHPFFRLHNADEHDLLSVPLKKVGSRYTFDLDAMEAVFSERTRLLMLCSPHNPVGTVFTEAELVSVCELARQYDTIVVSDEIHNGLVLNDAVRHVPTALAAGNYAHSTITLMSQSKTFNLAGMNCSFSIIPDPDIRKAFDAECAVALGSNQTFNLESARAAFSEGEAWRQQLVAYLRENQLLVEQTLNALPGVSVTPADATYLAWIDVTDLRLNDPQAFFVENGVGLSPGAQFGQPGFVRLNFACPRSTLKTALERMVTAVESLNQGA